MAVVFREKWPPALHSELVATIAALEPGDRALMSDLLGDKLYEPLAAFPMDEADGASGVFIWNTTPVDIARGGDFIHLFLPPIQFECFHSHYADSSSSILAGGYDELWRPKAWREDGQVERRLRKGDYVERRADEGHYVRLPPDIPYALTRYKVGPASRQSAWHYDPLVGMVQTRQTAR
jgi:hypothetical protein